MRSSHDDLPHPVPPIANLRWKENYFFVFICHEQGVFGIGHLNNEPAFNRSRFACALTVDGERFTYNSETELPSDFGKSDTLSDGKMTMRVVQSHEELTLTVAGDNFKLNSRFTARMPSFDFGACSYAVPKNYSYKEAMTFGTNLPWEHLQQAMRVGGTLELTEQSRTITLDGYGYRDHSWGMRTDNAVAWHVWTGLHFPDAAFGIMTLEMLDRPGSVAKEGYVADARGVRVLSEISVLKGGKREGHLPEHVTFDVTDVEGNRYLIRADVAGRLADVHHENEKGTVDTPGYSMTETFCRLTMGGADEVGIGLVEVGDSAIARPG